MSQKTKGVPKRPQNPTIHSGAQAGPEATSRSARGFNHSLPIFDIPVEIAKTGKNTARTRAPGRSFEEWKPDGFEWDLLAILPGDVEQLKSSANGNPFPAFQKRFKRVQEQKLWSKSVIVGNVWRSMPKRLKNEWENAARDAFTPDDEVLRPALTTQPKDASRSAINPSAAEHPSRPHPVTLGYSADSSRNKEPVILVDYPVILPHRMSTDGLSLPDKTSAVMRLSRSVSTIIDPIAATAHDFGLPPTLTHPISYPSLHFGSGSDMDRYLRIGAHIPLKVNSPALLYTSGVSSPALSGCGSIDENVPLDTPSPSLHGEPVDSYLSLLPSPSCEDQFSEQYIYPNHQRLFGNSTHRPGGSSAMKRTALRNSRLRKHSVADETTSLAPTEPSSAIEWKFDENGLRSSSASLHFPYIPHAVQTAGPGMVTSTPLWPLQEEDTSPTMPKQKRRRLQDRTFDPSFFGHAEDTDGKDVEALVNLQFEFPGEVIEALQQSQLPWDLLGLPETEKTLLTPPQADRLNANAGTPLSRKRKHGEVFLYEDDGENPQTIVDDYASFDLNVTSALYPNLDHPQSIFSLGVDDLSTKTSALTNAVLVPFYADSQEFHESLGEFSMSSALPEGPYIADALGNRPSNLQSLGTSIDWAEPDFYRGPSTTASITNDVVNFYSPIYLQPGGSSSTSA